MFAALLLWVFFVHLVGVALFTRGFLLKRLSLSDTNDCSSTPCTLQPTHTRAVVLIMDALRFDFLTPEPPEPPSPYHHNILTLPRELTHLHPQHSLLFNAFADPPTTTLQRIKGLTTGSLPSFIEIGSNFGGSSVAEDSILHQLRAAGKKVAFMGDDTWMTVFPHTFEPNMTFPYDSFDVEDLHTVDEGVIHHLFPLLADKNKPFDFLIGHFLGVDHVGHRLGPDHPSMKAKLEQMNRVLSKVVELLEDDTLLVVLGDHGMDRTGDHGGDGELETASALWIYSKGPPIFLGESSISPKLLPTSIFPGTTIPRRTVQQIDLVPSLSLLLGLPIPFTNLGTVIPELFSRDLAQALEITATQIKKYLDLYRVSAFGGELDVVWPDLQSSWSKLAETSGVDRMIALNEYNKFALATCRSLWAQFNPLLMGMGLAVLGIGLLATCALFSKMSDEKSQSGAWIGVVLRHTLRAIAGGSILGFFGFLSFGSFLPGPDALDCVLFAAALLSSFVIIISTHPKLSISLITSISVPLILHVLVFLSNSFTVWEDHIITFLLASSIVRSVLIGFTAPTTRLRWRILGFSLLFAICVRLIAMSTVCREEQQSYCHITFFVPLSLLPPAISVIILAVSTSLALPSVIQRFLGISKSDRGVAEVFLPWILRPALFAGTLYWILEWVDSAGLLESDWTVHLRGARTVMARLAMGAVITGGAMLWWPTPICMEVLVESVPQSGSTESKKQVTVFGFANAFGSPYFIFWTIFLGIVYAATQLTGQLVLALGVIALLAYLEVVDSVRDVGNFDAIFASSNSPGSTTIDPTANTLPLRFSEIVPLALLGLHIFHGTGHQSVISTIQWKAAFLLTPTVTYPFSVITVVLNSLGPQFLVGLAVPLLATWNRAPVAAAPTSAGKAGEGSSTVSHIRKESVHAAIGMMMYYASLLLGSAASVAVLRRHLMVWKVFAPRFMSAILGLLAVDLGVLLGVGVGVWRISKVIEKYQ